jgi:hypothetical protein
MGTARGMEGPARGYVEPVGRNGQIERMEEANDA